MDLQRLAQHLTEHQRARGWTPLFASLSGAHLYGFESPDSDVDLRGAYVLPIEQVVGLSVGAETVTTTTYLPPDNLELDLVCHDILKFCRLLVKRSGEVLEQLYSPWVVFPSPQLDRLRELAGPLITRQFFYHYRGFLANQMKFVASPEATVKELLYGYRVALTGIHLLESGRCQPHLPSLLELYPQAGVGDLIELKRTSFEQLPLEADLKGPHQARLLELEQQLQQAFDKSSLPLEADTRELHDFVVEVRLAGR